VPKPLCFSPIPNKNRRLGVCGAQMLYQTMLGSTIQSKPAIYIRAIIGADLAATQWKKMEVSSAYKFSCSKI
jgi:hypothetical protein